MTRAKLKKIIVKQYETRLDSGEDISELLFCEATDEIARLKLQLQQQMEANGYQVHDRHLETL